MTTSPSAPQVSFQGLEGAVAVLRDQGLRISAARRLVLRVLFSVRRPLSAEQIATELEGTGPGLDVASVYRNLETFERYGVVRHVHLGHGPGLYAPVGEGEREYLFCERCGEVLTVEPHQLDRVREAVQDGFGYEARFTHFPIVGLCARCASSSD